MNSVDLPSPRRCPSRLSDASPTGFTEPEQDKNSAPIRNLLLIVLLPVVCLVGFSSFSVYTAVKTSLGAQDAHTSINEFIPVIELISALQVERGSSAMYISSQRSRKEFFKQLQDAQAVVDDILGDMGVWLEINVKEDENITHLIDSRLAFSRYITKHRTTVYMSDVTIYDSLYFYTNVSLRLMDVVFSHVNMEPVQAVWKAFVSYGAILKITDLKGTQRALGAHFYVGSNCYFENTKRSWYINLEAQILELTSMIAIYSPEVSETLTNMREYNRSLLELIDFMEDEILNHESSSHHQCLESTREERFLLGMAWFDSVTGVIDMEIEVKHNILKVLLHEIEQILLIAKIDLISFSLVMVVVTVLVFAMGTWYGFRLHKFRLQIKAYSQRVSAQVLEIDEGRRLNERLLHQMLPYKVAKCLIQGQEVTAEAFDCVTLYFSDLVGFTRVSATRSPHQVVDLLNSLYRAFDDVIDRFDVYKVETIADAYMVVSGAPEPNGNNHVREIANLSFEMMKKATQFVIPFDASASIKLRIGLHSGPVVGGIVGTKTPRYCLFGDTVNTCSRMQTTGKAHKIHISADMRQKLIAYEEYNIILRGQMNIKGKGSMTTFWLIDHRAD